MTGSLISTLPGRAYTDESIFAREQEHIFETMWFCVARADDLPSPGAFRTVTVGRESILLTRARDGSIHAFFNVCRHRGARLCTEPSGTVQRAIRCHYHAWTYDLTGKLIAAPNLTKMTDIDRDEYGLNRVHLREWLGYVWVCLADDPPSFEDQVIGAVTERLGDPAAIDKYDVENLSLGRRISYDVKANWKLIVENFMECYHCATIHPELVEVLPEFADGYAAQYYVGHGALFGEEIEGFTVDGSPGLDRIPSHLRGAGPALLRGDHPAAGLPQPGARPRHPAPDVPAGGRPHHRRVRLALPARRRSGREGSRQVGRAVPPGQPAGLRGVRAVPAGDELAHLRSGWRAGPDRAPHRRVPRVVHREGRFLE